MGGRIRIIGVGSAPVSQEIIDFLKICFSAPIFNGYGQTEGLGVQFASCQEEIDQESIGGPFQHCQFKLVDVQEMGYSHKDRLDGLLSPRGELWVRGSSVIDGYFKLPD